jgi:tetratricopeptide (TPR) repeat protein
MTKWAVPRKPLSQLDRVREALDRVEVFLSNLKGSGPDVVQVLFLLDQVARQLEELEAAGATPQAERGRLESSWQKLRRNASGFLREAGPALEQARQRREDPTDRPWWSLDERHARLQRRQLGRGALLALAVVALLAVGWGVYERFLAPPPEVRLALRYMSEGETAVATGEWEEALAAFEAAATLTPGDRELHIWIGVLRQELEDEAGARSAYATARELSTGELRFLFERGTIFIQLGDVEAAAADAEVVIELDPEWGYGYYLQASVDSGRGAVQAAAENLRRAADLAHEAGDTELESLARVQLGLLMQYAP